MDFTKYSTVTKKSWLVFLCLSIAAVIYYRVAGAEVGGSDNWMRNQVDEGLLASLDPSPRYLCVGKSAFDLGQDSKMDLTENALILDRLEAQKKCTLPHFPTLEGVEALLVANSPDSGFATTFLSFEMEDKEAIKTLTKSLEGEGWRETTASKIGREKSPSLKSRVYERRESWLLTTVSSTDPINKKSKILVAGHFDPALMR